MALKSRLALVHSLGTAIRTATRPGSPSLGERAGAVPRMVRATLSGEYAGISKGRLALLAAAVGYIVSPVDLLPEGLLAVVGLADDAMVMSWVAATLVNETEAFLAWERSAPRAGTSYANPRYADGNGRGQVPQGPSPQSTGGVPGVTPSTASGAAVSSARGADEARRHDEDDLPPRSR